ncbi:MAG: carbamoyltransferase HypF [Candidatus Methanomethylicaceae archaeon]
MQKRAHIFVRGLVQGVGFRPFIYTIATDRRLKGYVLNLGDAGVEILVEGEVQDIKSFIDDIRKKKPSVAKIDAIELEWKRIVKEFDTFFIAESKERRLTVRSVIPTDLSICDVCITDVQKKSRWNNYPFTSCAQCGPRFTIIRKLPYDRDNTAMVDFPFCVYCKAEYDNPMDRRYDAQGITCPLCGPKLNLLNNDNKQITCEPLCEAAKLLDEGYIIAIKGIGGFHIAVDATNEEAVNKLRTRRIRPFQPFAVISSNIAKVKNFAIVSKVEEELLANIYHPIITLQKSEHYCLADSVSPGLDTIGVMLPYTGIHLLLLNKIKKDALVMTSGNYPGKPIYIENSEAQEGLKNIVDYYLTHNRSIINRCDDSVMKVVENEPLFLRKSRGYAPSTLPMPWNVGAKGIISVGGEYNVTGSLFVEDRLVTTQHIGDMNELETLDYLKRALNFITAIYDKKEFGAIAHDLNPSFLTTRYARELANQYQAKDIPVQHHHAHMASLMADHSLPRESSIVCIAIDGVGYGTDNMAWGGEILLGGYSQFERVGQLKYQPMPGGDACATHPARMLAAILSTTIGCNEIYGLFENDYAKHLKQGLDELDTILKQSKINNVLKTSSIGRLLDSIATLLNVCHLRTYEGEPPMRLETLAKKGRPGKVTLELSLSQQNGKYVLDTSEFMLSIVENLHHNNREDIAFEVHHALGGAFGKLACRVCDENCIHEIGLTGGSAVNSLLFKYIKDEVVKNNKKFLCYKTIPCGDGGTSTGQATVASLQKDM